MNAEKGGKNRDEKNFRNKFSDECHLVKANEYYEHRMALKWNETSELL